MTTETYTFPAGTTLESLKQAEKEAQRAYSKGEGTLEAAREAGRSVHRFREEARRNADHNATQRRQARVDCALSRIEKQVYEVSTREPNHFCSQSGAIVLSWCHGAGYNVLFVVGDREKMAGIQGTLNIREADDSVIVGLEIAAMESDETLAILESAAGQ